MIFNKNILYASLASTAFAGQSLRVGRQLSEPCGQLMGCYLWDKTAKVEVLLNGDFDSYCPSDSSRGWSVRCDTAYPTTVDSVGNEVTATIDEIKFYYDGKVKDEYGEPRWMNGDADPTEPGDARWINDVAYLATPGDKVFSIEGRQWSRTCFEQEYVISDNCSPKQEEQFMPKALTDAPTSVPMTVPPQMTMCARAAYKMHYAPNVPVGWRIEGINPDGEAMFLDVQGISPRPLERFEERWWHAFSTHFLPNYDTKLRFVNEMDVAGPWQICKKNSPIGIDIDGSGEVERIEGQFTIDITGDGDIETLNEWFAPTEGILIDVTHGIEDGIIDGHHLFGDMGGTFSDGFAKLTLHDDNQDGYVAYEELNGFAIWTDANSNAKLDDGELSSLDSHGIISLSTTHTSLISYATLEDGSKMHMEDLWFAR